MSDSGTIYVDCPCCGTRLEARREDGKVVGRWKRAEKPEGDPLQAALARQRAEKERIARLLADPNKVLEEHRRRAEESFQREKERVEREGDTGPPPSPFGFD